MIPTSSLDQPLSKDQETKIVLLSKVKEEIEKAEHLDDALNVIKQLIIISELSGLALAEAYYLVHHKFKPDEDEMFEKLGKKKVTIERYIRVWTLFEEGYVPEHLIDTLQNRNIKDLIPMGNAVDQGYEFFPEDWEYLATAPDFNVVSKYIREEVKGKPPRKSSVRLYLKRNGDLLAYQGTSSYVIGYLDVGSKAKTIIKA